MEGSTKKVRVYSLSTCPTCKKVKEFLSNNGISYHCIDVDTLDSGEQWVTSKELKKYNPSGSYPTIVIEEVLLGFNEALLKDTLGIK
jgi:glutaredoxin-like protein NrdH